MNEKLFKKLNEKVELISIKNSVVITEAVEMDLIFNGYSFDNLFDNSLTEAPEYWLRDKYQEYYRTNKDYKLPIKKEEANKSEKKKEEKVKKPGFSELHRLQKEYLADIKMLDNDHQMAFYIDSIKDIKKKIDIDEKLSFDEKRDLYRKLDNVKADAKERYNYLMNKLEELNSNPEYSYVKQITKLSWYSMQELFAY